MPKPPRTTVLSAPPGDQANPNRGEMLIASVERKIWWRLASMTELYGVVGVSWPAASSALNEESSTAAQLSWHTGLELCSARSASVSFRLLLTRHSSCPYTPIPHKATGSEERDGKVCR